MECEGVGKKKRKKNQRKSPLSSFFVAATSGNLCEVSLPPLLILFACGIYFLSLIYFLLFVCAEFH